MQSKKRVILWFRQDLRLHDNEALHDALKSADEVLPIFIFDTRIFKGKTRDFGFKKTEKFRAQFVIEAVKDLKKSLKSKGSDLVVRIGKPEEILFELASKNKTSWIFCNRERAEEEVRVQDILEEKLWSIGQEIRYSRGKMLFYTSDLPFPVTHTPDVFTHFRKEVEKYIPIREPLPIPEDIKPFDLEIEVGDIPALEDFGHQKIERKPHAAFQLEGGETAGLERLKDYLWNTDHVANYVNTRNEMLGESYSTKLSPYLAQGCLSPKMIYSELKKYENTRTKNKSTYHLGFELLWRDFFRLMGKKNGNKIFQKLGTKGKSEIEWKNDKRLFKIWAEGKTGIPFIDANMRELNQTGFMSNRGRQNVASFLVKDLKVNWQMGAEYFESLLVDYDVMSNWGNWNYIAGVGNDPREARYFNILSQAKKYDGNGEYAKNWLPELKLVPNEKIHNLDKLTDEEKEKYSLKIGLDYPKNMVSLDRWR